MEKIKSILKGKFSKKTLTYYYLPLVFGVFLFCLFLAWIFYPYDEAYPYDWTTSMISRLGWPIENPIGLIPFSLGMLILGVFLIPVAYYTYERLSQLQEKLAIVILILMLAHAVALIGIGAIPNFPEVFFKLAHAINAGVIFTGVYIAGILTLMIILNNRANFSSKLLIIYIVVLIYGTTTAILTVINIPGTGGHYIHDPSTPLLMSPPFYEWQTFIAMLCVIYLQCIIIPEFIPKS